MPNDVKVRHYKGTMPTNIIIRHFCSDTVHIFATKP